MQIGIVGLGRMGGNMARRLRRGGAEVIGFDADKSTAAALASNVVALACFDAVESPPALVARTTVCLFSEVTRKMPNVVAPLVSGLTAGIVTSVKVKSPLSLGPLFR